jgi:hypothetical protein
MFNDLYQNAILPRRIHNPGLQGPKLCVVQAAICDGESHGDRKYSAWQLDTSQFNETDYYALCLYRLRTMAKESRGGIFRDKQMTDIQIDARLWQAMLRGSLEVTKAKAKNPESARSIYLPPVFSDSKQQPSKSSTANAAQASTEVT